MNGILMTPDNQKAIRDKVKTQTRRLDHLKEINKNPNRWTFQYCNPQGKIDRADDYWLFLDKERYLRKEPIKVKPRYRIGETVYIKEGWRIGCYTYKKEAEIIYKLRFGLMDYHKIVDWNDWLEKNTKYGGSNVGDGEKWRSSMFMPAWAARDYIKITDVRPERLRDITLEDAYDEGIDTIPAYDRIDAFKRLWDSINGKTYPFDGNYWVWRICFNLIEDKR